MTEALFRGLFYGMVAGFSVLGFALTLAGLYGLIWAGISLHDYFTGAQHDEQRGRR